jgi:hypothetical protein
VLVCASGAELLASLARSISMPSRPTEDSRDYLEDAPRVGSSEAAQIVRRAFAAGLPVFLEAYFFRCGCAPDYFLFRTEAAFWAHVSRYCGNNPELLLSPVDDFCRDEWLLESWQSGSETGLKQRLVALLERAMLLLLVFTRGNCREYHLVYFESDLDEAVDRGRLDWQVTAYDAWSASERSSRLFVMPRQAGTGGRI